MVIWQQDMPKIDVGVWQKERARLIDGCKRRAIMGIQSFIWTAATWVERPRIERHRCWLESFRRIVVWPLIPCRARVTQHRWMVSKLVKDVIMTGVQTVVVKSNQEAPSMDAGGAFMRELRSIEGCKVMPEESQAGESAANAVVERSVWEMQSTARSLIAYAGWVHNTTFDPGSAILALAVVYSGRWLVGSRGVFQMAKRRMSVGNRKVTARR